MILHSRITSGKSAVSIDLSSQPESYSKCLPLIITSAALENEEKIHNPNWFFPEAVVDVYCGDTAPTRKNVCRKRPNPRDPDGPWVTAFASAWTARGTFYNTYNVVLCPRFFEEKTSLESILADMNSGRKQASNASEYKFSWGHTIYHELMHLSPVIASEVVDDVVYGACPVAKLANQNGCSGSPVIWIPPGWNVTKKGDPQSMINADSWSFFASGVYFQKAMQLTEPGRPEDDCGIYRGENLANFTYRGQEYDPEGILLPTVNRTDGTFNASIPPDPALENTPPEDPPTPLLPYKFSNLSSGLATPFNAEAYFATYTPAALSNSSVPTLQSTTATPATTSLPPEPSSSSCKYTVLSETGLTISAYILQPTTATICLCDSTVIVGINTVTGTSSTSYLVCAIPSGITVSTLQPPFTASSSLLALTTLPPSQTATATPVLTSQDCVECTNAMGASVCSPSDNQCLVNQCNNDPDCQSCKIDCNIFG